MKFNPMIELTSAIARLLLDDVLDLADDVGGSPDRGAVRQLHDDEEGALVVGREEPARRHPGEQARCRRTTRATTTIPNIEIRTSRATIAP